MDAYPIRRVKVAGFTPHHVGGRGGEEESSWAEESSWVVWRDVGGFNTGAWVPAEVFDAMPGPPPEDHGGMSDWHRHFPTAEAAADALSAALLAVPRARPPAWTPGNPPAPEFSA